MATGRLLVAASMLVCLTACSDAQPTLINPTATASTSATGRDTGTTSSPDPTAGPAPVTLESSCVLLFDAQKSPSLKLVTYLLQTSVTAKDNAEARQLLRRVRNLGTKTPAPLGELIGRLAGEIGKVVRARRTPGPAPLYDGKPIQRMGRRITRFCKSYV
ncbi:hypothetical protein [Nocardioides sp.]|jgi:hypothetical protein|uniref:hypothetical protein n=1 Tax=Nocardioides sp. TaxID=35761 RepID=UPI0031FF24F1|nr:hypothetical protein [Nocardioides sp.]